MSFQQATFWPRSDNPWRELSPGIFLFFFAKHLLKYLFNVFMTSLTYRNSTNQCSANQWTGFYMIGTSVVKELIELCFPVIRLKQLPAQAFCKTCQWHPLINVLHKNCSFKTKRKTPTSPATLIKKSLHDRYFPLNITNFFRIAVLYTTTMKLSIVRKMLIPQNMHE